MGQKEFKEQLEYYIRESGYTNYDFARVTGINRVNIQRYLAGTRVPSQQTFEIMLAKLRLSSSEREELIESFKLAFAGPDVYYLQKTIREMLERAADVCGLDPEVSVDMSLLEHAEFELVHGQSAVERCIWRHMAEAMESQEESAAGFFLPAEHCTLGKFVPASKTEGTGTLGKMKIVQVARLAKRADR